ncbi:MAG: CBS domain-containing protein, partial [Acidimicrobiia bacterium]|nr:CBS domain-containing protein [Acidimicrobiia bacterium]
MTNPTTVAEAMTQDVVTAAPGETLAVVAERMDDHRVGSAVVVERNHPVGIVTERDLLRATAAGAVPETSTVDDWMAGDPECVEPDRPIDQAWRQLSERGYRHIPVVVGDELKGIISMRDLMALARLRPADEPPGLAPAGLKGVVVAQTALGDVRGTEGFYHYRQYAAPDLAAKRTFEDVVHLLI